MKSTEQTVAEVEQLNELTVQWIRETGFKDLFYQLEAEHNRILDKYVPAESAIERLENSIIVKAFQILAFRRARKRQRELASAKS